MSFKMSELAALVGLTGSTAYDLGRPRREKVGLRGPKAEKRKAKNKMARKSRKANRGKR